MHGARVLWRAEGDVRAGRYSRGHEWRFDGGAVVAASASPVNVPEPWSRPEAVDPEEAFVAAIASCHMLWFLDLAQRAGFAALRYEDAAEARMAAREDGTWWLAEVILAPRVAWDGAPPDPDAYAALHEAAHEACFIANSVRSRMTVRLDCCE